MKNNKNIEKMLYDLVDNGETHKESIYQEVVSMKKSKNRKILNWKSAVVACSLMFTLTVTGFAGELYGIIKEAVLPSGSELVQMKDDPNMKIKISDKYEVYDEDGNRVNELTLGEIKENVYFDKDGLKIEDDKIFELNEVLDNEDMYIVTGNEKISSENTIKTTLEEVSSKLTFKPYILNEKYELENIEHFHGKDAKNINVLSFEYNGPKGNIYMQQRENTLENQVGSGGEGEIVEKTISGVKLLMQDGNLWFEKDNTLFLITYHGANTDDLIELYNDITPYK